MVTKTSYGPHGSEYNLEGPEGGLDWDRINKEYEENEDPEVLAQSKLEAARLRKRGPKATNTALERSRGYDDEE
jgi:hypothetical protein